MRTFLEKLMFFILISIYLMGQQTEVFTIFLGLCIFILSLSIEVFENSWIQRISLVISGALSERTLFYVVAMIKNSVRRVTIFKTT